MKNNLTVTRGEGGGDNEGKGFQELFIIKDTWTKPRKGVESGEGSGYGWGVGKMQETVLEQQ